MIVWKTRCQNQVKWEREHMISHKDKCTQVSDADNDEEESLSDNIIESHRLNTHPLHIPHNIRDDSGTSQLQVLDDIVNPIRPITSPSNSNQEKTIRRTEAALLTWKDMTIYVKHNYTAKWMPRMTKYFNKFTRMSDELWDDSVEAGVS